MLFLVLREPWETKDPPILVLDLESDAIFLSFLDAAPNAISPLLLNSGTSILIPSMSAYQQGWLDRLVLNPYDPAA